MTCLYESGVCRLKQYSIHLLDRDESDVCLVVQIEANIGRSEADEIEVDIGRNKSNVKQGSVQQMFCYAESIEL